MPWHLPNPLPTHASRMSQHMYLLQVLILPPTILTQDGDPGGLAHYYHKSNILKVYILTRA